MLVSAESSYENSSRILGVQMYFPPLYCMPKIPPGYSRSLEVISSIWRLTGYTWFPDICIRKMILSFSMPHASSCSQSRACIHEKEFFRFNFCAHGTFYFISSPLFFLHAPNCIFHSEHCKEMLLFLFYPSLDCVKDDFKIIGYIKALLSQEHNKSVN